MVLAWQRGQARPCGQRRRRRYSRHFSSVENARFTSIMVIGVSMPKKKPKPKEPLAQPPSLADMTRKDLLQSIRDDLAEKAKQAELARPESPLKPPKSR